MGLRQQACQVAKGGGGTGNGFEGSPAAELLVVLGTFFFEAFIHCFGKDRQQLISREASQAARQGCSGLTEPKDVRSRVVKDRCTIIRMETREFTIGPAGVMEWLFRRKLFSM